MIEDGAQASGSVTTVRRVGDTIRRPCGRWTPLVHALLGHLHDVGFTRAPRVLGIDESGCEVLSLLDGEVAMRPWPAVLRGDEGVTALARWLREFHSAVAEFRPPRDAEWFAPDVRWRPGQVVRHGDLGPWNSVWRGAELVGFIDWDFAEPGSAIDDLAQLAWHSVPLRGAQQEHAAGFGGGAPLRRRLELLCAGYGADPAQVLAGVAALQERESGRIEHWGGRGVEPWRTFLDRGDVASMAAERAWLRENLSSLTPAPDAR
ncbi:aminoglycoside phosphotransferase family protein [Kitasatospora sp. NPDC059722]|uniref:aminoglycoside phosphotransferase family protein n=1 Tax=Kitasatospora sp. NPDC059722 TaxID=3346925 RepID=UPI0036C64C62